MSWPTLTIAKIKGKMGLLYNFSSHGSVLFFSYVLIINTHCSSLSIYVLSCLHSKGRPHIKSWFLLFSGTHSNAFHKMLLLVGLWQHKTYQFLKLMKLQESEVEIPDSWIFVNFTLSDSVKLNFRCCYPKSKY